MPGTDEILQEIGKDPYYISKLENSALTREILLAAVREEPETLGIIPVNKISMELCKAAVSQNAYAIRHVPDAFKNGEICELAYSINPETLKYIPYKHKTKEMFKKELFFDAEKVLKEIPGKFIDDETGYIAVSVKPESYNLLPESLKKKSDIILKTLSKDGRMLRNIPEGMQTEEMVVAALKTSGTAVLPFIRIKNKNIASEIQSAENLEAVRKFKEEIAEKKITLKKATGGKTDKESLAKALDMNPYLLGEIKLQERTYDLCLKAVGLQPRTITEVPLKHRSAFLCNMAVRKDAGVLEFIPYELRTEEVCRYCVEREGESLSAVPEKYKTYDLCLAAARKDLNAIYHVPKEFIDENFTGKFLEAHKNKRNAGAIVLNEIQDGTSVELSDEYKKTVRHIEKLKKNWEYIKNIPAEELTDKLCLTAVGINPEAIRYISRDRYSNALAEKMVKHGEKGFELLPEEFKSLKLQRKSIIVEIINKREKSSQDKQEEVQDTGKIKIMDKTVENIIKSMTEEEKEKYFDELKQKLKENHIRNDFDSVEEQKKEPLFPKYEKLRKTERENDKLYCDIDRGELASPFRKGFLYSETEAAEYYRQYLETELRKLEKSPVYRELKKISEAECEELRIFSENKHIAAKAVALISCIKNETIEKVIEMKGGPLSCSVKSINHKTLSERYEELKRLRDERIYFNELNKQYKGKLELPKMKIEDEKLTFEGNMLRIPTEEAVQKSETKRNVERKAMALYALDYWRKKGMESPVNPEYYKKDKTIDSKEYYNAVIREYLREHHQLPDINGTRGTYNIIGDSDRGPDVRSYSDHAEGYQKEKQRVKGKNGRWKTLTVLKELDYHGHVNEKYEGNYSQGELYALAFEAGIQSIKRDAAQIYSLEDIFKNEPMTIIRDENGELKQYNSRTVEEAAAQPDFQYFDEIDIKQLEKVEDKMEKIAEALNNEAKKIPATLKDKFTSFEKVIDMHVEFVSLRTRKEEMTAYLSEIIQAPRMQEKTKEKELTI